MRNYFLIWIHTCFIYSLYVNKINTGNTIKLLDDIAKKKNDILSVGLLETQSLVK